MQIVRLHLDSVLQSTLPGKLFHLCASVTEQYDLVQVKGQ